MQVQVNSNHIEGSAQLQEWVGSTVVEQLERFEELLTRVEIHVSDENAQKGGAQDKRCQIEFRPKGHHSMSVSHKAESLHLAVEGAAAKARHALEHLTGKLDARPVSSRELNDPLAEEGTQATQDALLQEEFLAKQGEEGVEPDDDAEQDTPKS
ncbi:HPF/RaiA family ribosome-associated protein [Pseudomonas sp. gcc21]|uniref:HPF/RaiA family ribosome-associated protein n=1 Tax=Pseudomonas sp. gcc21 TaxID=2726989 RepID=UPI0014514DEC|nr:HPF/RaiA family ribosome-associated protein [Pseudomonas sp. gcc21]QJD58376.1 HPF/RaiA family ribosome-associated protein [Pseudomonas sp. gcc21]